MSKDLFKQISELETEQINPNTTQIDILSTGETLKLINQEDHLVAEAVKDCLDDITKVTEYVIHSFNNNGRLIYIGAGTSGRLGILDASECPPTFGSNPEMVQGLIAGGQAAVFQAKEGAEDSRELGTSDLKSIKLSSDDVLIGLAASGRTPYVLGGLQYANELGCKTALIATITKKRLKDLNVKADILIAPQVGPEVVMGSTRMKSGTAQKMILNMITTTAFVKLGKTFNNVMIDLQMTNEKLKNRAVRILMLVTDCDQKTAIDVLSKANDHVKSAILMILKDCSFAEAQNLLDQNNGFVKLALKK